MKKLIFCLITCIMLLACGSTNQISDFDSVTIDHKRIAILPLQSKIKLKEKQKDALENGELEQLELAQAKSVQDAVESYLIGRDLRVRIQSSNMTNSKLKQNRIDIKFISDEDYTKLASILGVDAVVGGYIETEKPMSDAMATGIEIAKKLETTLVGSFLGSSISTSTNKGLCKLSLYDGSSGDRLWSYSEDIEMGKGSTSQDIIENMMKNGANNFPYKR